MLKTLLLALLCLSLTISTALAVDEQIYEGHIPNDSEAIEYELSLKEGEAVIISTLAHQSGNLDTVLTVYNPDGSLFDTNDDGDIATYDSWIGFVTPASGIYKIVVSRYDSSTSGAFTLTITTGDLSIFEYDVPLNGTRLTYDSEHFRFHYTLEGEDAVDKDYLDAIVQAFEEAWEAEIEVLGWAAPPTDHLMGGNALYDVYIYDLIGTDEDAIGYASRELPIGDNDTTPRAEDWAATSFIAMDNDFHDVSYADGQDNLSLMRATAIHELHHAIQFGYDAYEAHDWLGEATSVWMETIVGGKDQDATGYVGVAYDYPELCFGTNAQDGAIMYGEWMFMQFLTDAYGDDAVLNLWEALIEFDGFEALAELLAAHDNDIPRFVAHYRIKNLTRDYELAPLFNATVWLEEIITGAGMWTFTGKGIQELGANYFKVAAPPDLYSVAIQTDDDDLEVWAVGVKGGELQAFALGRGGEFDTRPFSDTYLMVFNRRYDENITDCDYSDYRLLVGAGKGSPAPLDSTWDATHYEPPR